MRRGAGLQNSDGGQGTRLTQNWVVSALLRAVRGYCLLGESQEEEWVSPLGEAQDIRGLGPGSVESFGWDQTNKALNTSQGVPTLACGY